MSLRDRTDNSINKKKQCIMNETIYFFKHIKNSPPYDTPSHIPPSVSPLLCTPPRTTPNMGALLLPIIFPENFVLFKLPFLKTM